MLDSDVVYQGDDVSRSLYMGMVGSYLLGGIGDFWLTVLTMMALIAMVSLMRVLTAMMRRSLISYIPIGCA